VRIRYAIAAAAILAGCAKPDMNPKWDTFRDGFIEGALAADPSFAVYEGRHDFDGKLPDFSDAGLAKRIAFLKSSRDSAAKFDSASLSPANKIEREYLIAVAENHLFWLETSDYPHKNPDFYVSYLGAGIGPDVYLVKPYAPLPDRMKAYIMWAKAIPTVTAQIQTNLHPPLARSMIDVGRLRYGGFAAYLTNDVPKVFAEIKDTALTAQFKTANAAAAKAFSDLDKWLEAQRKTQTENFALGAKNFSEMLRATEMVDTPLDQLEKVGREDMAKNVAALKDACAKFAPGKTVPQCIAKASADKPKHGELEEGRKQLDTLEAFVRAKDLVSIPGTEKALVRASPPFQMGNGAYIDPAGPYDKGMPSVYYISPPDPKWSKADQDAYIPGVKDLLFTSVHEVWPGHFLQFLHSNRAPSKLGQLFVGYAFAEGWAHYTEQMMWDAGLGDGDPETHIGQLQNALLRNARYLSAIGMHSGTMTTAQSEKLFTDEAFQDVATARQQAARGTYDPPYLNYTLGKLMIMKLREDWTASRGGRTAWKAFHDAFLSYGGPPIPLVRKAMLGDKAGPAL
jgi:uncharacterized protein (DUF885 family)